MFSIFRRGQSQTAPIPLSDAIAAAQTGALTLLDVREPSECSASGWAKGAVKIPLAALRMKADPASPERHPDLDPQQPIAIYCASGGRSAMAARMLQDLGYVEVHNIGGFGRWAAAGGPVER